MSVEQSVEWEFVGETDVLGETLPQGNFIHHKSHMILPGFELGHRGGKTASNGLSYDTAYYLS
jgi:hypothetical protein